MQPFQPLINLLVLMSALSIAAERLTNALKLGNEDLREPRTATREEKNRERHIARRALSVSVLLAVAIKADFFELLARMDAPWATLGWQRFSGSISLFLYSVAGSALTGLALGFGSKFWHDVLDIVYSTRGRIKNAQRHVA